MNEQMFQMMSSVAQSVIALAALIASIAIPLIIYKAQKRRETLEFIHAVRTMWISIDTTVLQRDELMEIADSILEPHVPNRDLKERQRSWIALMILNAVYMDYLGAKNGFHSKMALSGLSAFLKDFLINDAVFQKTQSEAYDAGFRQFCREVKQSILVRNP